MEETLLVEIIAYAPTAYYHCMHCEVAWREMGATNQIHDEQVRTSLPSDLIQEYQAISDWVREIFLQYGDRVIIKVIDAASIEGFYKTLRYGVRKYPAVIVDGKKCYPGGALQDAGNEIARLLTKDKLSAVQPSRR
jgi:hypothetical protein